MPNRLVLMSLMAMVLNPLIFLELFALVNSLLGMVSGAEPVVKCITAGRWVLTTIMKLHRKKTIGAGSK